MTDRDPRASWWRRLARPSVRLLMLLVLVAGCVIFWVTHRARVQREAVLAVERGGGTAHYDWEYKQTPQGPRLVKTGTHPPAPAWLVKRVGVDYFGDVVSVQLGPREPDAVTPHVARLPKLRYLSTAATPKGSGLTNAGLAHLASLSQLETLRLEYAKITGAGLVHLRALKHLRDLRLPQRMPIEDADLAALSGLTELEHFEASGLPHITDSGLAHLKSLTKMRRLILTGCKVTSAGLQHFRGMTALQVLNLTWCSWLDSLEPLADLRALESLSVDTARLKDSGTQALSNLRALKSFYARGTPLGDAGVAPLASLMSLENVGLSNTLISDQALAGLSGHKTLKTLWLDQTKITDAGLSQLRDLPALEMLSLRDTAVSDAGLKGLSRFPALRSLILDGTQVGDAGLENLADAKGLLTLGLRGTRITDAGMASLGKLTSLQRISLRSTSVSNAGLASLHGLGGLNRLGLGGVSEAGSAIPVVLGSLRYLDLTATHVTPEARAAFRKAHPRLQLVP